MPNELPNLLTPQHDVAVFVEVVRRLRVDAQRLPTGEGRSKLLAKDELKRLARAMDTRWRPDLTLRARASDATMTLS